MSETIILYFVFKLFALKFRHFEFHMILMIITLCSEILKLKYEKNK